MRTSVMAAWSVGAMILAAGSALGQAVGNLYVTEEASGNVFEHNGITGAYVQVWGNSPPPVVNIMAIHTGGALGNVLIGSSFGGVRELDRTTGAVVRTYNSGGGWQWAGIWRPSNGNVLIGDMLTNDIREYDANTGAFIGVFATGIISPADMVYGPNGNLFVCSFNTGAGVYEINSVTGAIVAQWGLGMGFTNDIAFLPDGRRIVTSMGSNMAHVFDSSWNQIATFQGTGWLRPHGIAISPFDGNIYVVDGVTQAVHMFDATTYAELDPTFLTIPSKPVDLEFRPAIPSPGPAGLLALAALATGRRRRPA